MVGQLAVARMSPHPSQCIAVMGTPQERWRLMHQSGRCSTIPRMRSRPHLGSHSMSSIVSIARWRSG